MSRNVAAKKNEQILSDLLKEDANRQCADCGQKGTRWASWSIGVFLCIRCGGLHRKLGTHISKVKSVTLDTWAEEEIESIKSKGNAKVNAIYNPDPSRFPFPSFSGDMEQYIRDKYERKLFMNPGSRTPSTAPMSLGSAARKSFMDSARTTSNDFSTEIRQLNEMGFTNRQKCLNALESSNGNISQSIDILAASKSPSQSPPFKTSDPYADLIDSSFTSLKISNDSNKIGEKGDWDDFEFSDSKAEAKPAPEEPEPTPVRPSESQIKSPVAQQTSFNDPWNTNKPASSSLGSVLGSTNLFPDEDNDPFKELTHNPFK